MFNDCREGVKRNFELAHGKAAELGPLPEMMSSAAFADFGPDRRAMVRTVAITGHHSAHTVSSMPPLLLPAASIPAIELRPSSCRCCLRPTWRRCCWSTAGGRGRPSAWTASWRCAGRGGPVRCRLPSLHSATPAQPVLSLRAQILLAGCQSNAERSHLPVELHTMHHASP